MLRCHSLLKDRFQNDATDPRHLAVVRDGKRLNMDADLLVPGDVVSIKSGDRLPADLRLLQVTRAWTACPRTCTS